MMYVLVILAFLTAVLDSTLPGNVRTVSGFQYEYRNGPYISGQSGI